MPWYPSGDDGQGVNRYTVDSLDEHMVAKWANVPATEVGDMPYLDYLRYRRDSFVFSMKQTEKGVEYLDNAWLLSQTEPDRKASREFSA